jgi:hypothetical protein
MCPKEDPRTLPFLFDSSRKEPKAFVFFLAEANRDALRIK